MAAIAARCSFALVLRTASCACRRPAPRIFDDERALVPRPRLRAATRRAAVRLFDGKDRLSGFAERRRLAGRAADRPARGRGQEEDAAADEGPRVFQETRHNAALLFS